MIGIVDYGMGNLRSVYNAIEYIGEKPKLISTQTDFHDISHLIIPGVGAFETAMKNLHERDLVNPIKEFIASERPVLGICLGMQLLASIGYEPNETFGLDVIPGKIQKLDLLSQRVPHVGWNSIILEREHHLFNGIKKGVDFYFVHSYYYSVENRDNVLAYTDYEFLFPSVVNRKNVTGIQFHPEKSQKNGLKILENFSRLDHA